MGASPSSQIPRMGGSPSSQIPRNPKEGNPPIYGVNRGELKTEVVKCSNCNNLYPFKTKDPNCPSCGGKLEYECSDCGIQNTNCPYCGNKTK